MWHAGTWTTGGQDVVDGTMDFLYFCSAAYLALVDQEPEYLDGNDQFKAAFAMLAEQSMAIVNEGVDIEPFSYFHARELRDHFIASGENQEIREMLRERYGSDWTERVFGF